MILVQSKPQIRNLILRQISTFFPLEDEDAAKVDASLEPALERCDVSFSHVCNKYYRDDRGSSRFDPLHGCQWAFFQYALANAMFKMGGGSICDKVYAVSKAMCGADLFYQVELPSVFTFDHPLGAVMGRAAYSDFFSFSQGCTVGNNHGIYPSFGRSVFMLSDSKVIGSTTIGDNVIIGANAFVKDETVPSGSLVFGSSPNLIVKTGRADYVREYAEGVFVYD